MATSDILIVGGGIIGCALALRLAEEKLNVTVVERGEPGREASWAAAGMLAPTSEGPHFNPPEAELAAASAALYPDWLDHWSLRDAAGYRTEGTLQVAFTEDEAAGLRSLPGEILTGAGARRVEPALSERVVAAVFLSHDVQVDNRRLVEAVTQAAQKAGVKFRTGASVTELRIESKRIIGVRTATGETLAAGAVVNAAGCWASQLDRQRTPTRPIRGQMLALRGPEGSGLRHVVRSPRGYILPRKDGRFVIGSTSEDVGYDKNLTPTGLRQLLAAAIELVPSVASLPFADAWAGLRPDSPDHLPILGATDIENYFAATGHYRNGILLAPITAELVGDVILGRKPRLSLEPFSPLRFAPGV
ncbi:MAG TPA: glycine oxidase ThiO [Candidatus Acidoferrales bacterium]|nr:glycine oxidase ThiO [Candidatus Acidoferrales bacterium]